MDEGSAAAAECNGLDIPVLGCLDTGYWGLDATLALAPSLFTIWMFLLGGKQWRKRIREAIYDASWSTAYAGLLQKLLVRLRWFFGRPWSPRAFDTCFRLAMIYAFAYWLFAIVMGGNSSPTEKWILAGIFLVVGPTSFLIAHQVHCRHLQARQGSEHHRRRLWLHLREQLAYLVLGLVIVAVAVAVAEAGDVATATSVGIMVGIAGSVAGAGAVGIAGALVGALVGGLSRSLSRSHSRSHSLTRSLRHCTYLVHTMSQRPVRLAELGGKPLADAAVAGGCNPSRLFAPGWRHPDPSRHRRRHRHRLPVRPRHRADQFRARSC